MNCMNTKIKKIAINNLFGYQDVDWELGDVNVLVGKNGLGKSTILRLISTTLTQEPVDKELELCDSVHVIFNNGESVRATSKIELPPEFVKEALEKFISSEDFKKQFSTKIPNEVIIEKIEIPDIILQGVLKDKLFNDDLISYQFKKNENIYNVEFISTINLSANSINSIRTSDGRTNNVLDMEIRFELDQLLMLNHESNSFKEDFINSINFFFKESEKTVEIIDNNLKIHLKNGESIEYKHLSSGERQIIYIFLKVIKASFTNAIILMDEPEISLHLSWQESLLSQIRKVNKNSQIIVVTHSPAIVMNGWMDSFIDIKDIIQEV